jgi:hypothetical protein
MKLATLRLETLTRKTPGWIRRARRRSGGEVSEYEITDVMKEGLKRGARNGVVN